jgi:sulfide:quinone oxidoreductase
MTEHSHQIVIIGGGSAGISVAARLAQGGVPADVAIIEPSEKHHYQPIWTLVGAGVVDRDVSERDEAEFIPDGVTWIRQKVASFDPEHNAVTLENGDVVRYEHLVVAAGIQVDWQKVKGLKETLGKDGVCSNYSFEAVPKTWEFIRTFKGGTAIFTFPGGGPIKCAGAPQKIMYLAEEAFRRQGVREKSRVLFASAGGAIFGIPRYRAALEKVVAARGIDTTFNKDLIEVRASSKEAVFRDTTGGAETVLKYDLLHVVPPQSAPDFIKASPLADAAGWVDVDKYTLQHTRYENVWSLGDCSSLPCSKTGAAVRKQAPVLVQNLTAARVGRPMKGRYDGYASCPLVTGYGSLILAEFGYDGKIMETFPVNQAKERYSMYAMKAHLLPELYWHGMLRGRM